MKRPSRTRVAVWVALLLLALAAGTHGGALTIPETAAVIAAAALVACVRILARHIAQRCRAIRTSAVHDPLDPTAYATAPAQPEGGRLRAVARGLAAVVGLLLDAALTLLCALLSLRRRGVTGRLVRVVADEFRRGYHGAIDAECVEDDLPAETRGGTRG